VVAGDEGLDAPSLDPADNRYVGAFDQIRAVHHWLLSEAGKCFVHADIFCSSDEDEQQEGDDEQKASLWRRNANAVVKLVRAETKNSGSEHCPHVTSALTPVIENVNLDSSVNVLHRAIQLWLDADDLSVACANALPAVFEADDDGEESSHHHHHFLREGSVSILLDSDSPILHQHTPEKLKLEKWDDGPVLESGMTVAEFLQRRRAERESAAAGGGGGGMVRRRSDDPERKKRQLKVLLADATSSCDDGAGSLVLEEGGKE
jgi:hypothetical protein